MPARPSDLRRNLRAQGRRARVSDLSHDLILEVFQGSGDPRRVACFNSCPLERAREGPWTLARQPSATRKQSKAISKHTKNLEEKSARGSDLKAYIM